MRRISRWLTKHSVRENLYLLLMLEILIFVLWIFSAWLILGRNDIADAERKNEAVVSEIYNQLIYDVKELQQATAFPIIRDNNGLPSEIYKAFSKNPEQRVLSHEVSTSFDAQASTLMNYSSSISRICVINMAGSGLVYDKNVLWRNSSVFSVDISQPWAQNVIDGKGSVSAPMLLSSEELGYSNSEEYIYCARAIVSAEKNLVIGIGLVGIEQSHFMNLFEKCNMYEGQHFSMISQNGATLIGLLTDGLEIWHSDKSETHHFSYGRERVSVTCLYPQEAYLGVLLITPINALRQNVANYMLPVCVSICLLVIVTLLISGAIIRSIYSPLKMLLAAVEAYSNGQFDVRTECEAGTEFSALQNALNTMAERIQNLIDEVYVHQLEKKDYQLRLLRSQTNPHFLYNALESARMRAYIKDDKVLERMLLSLASVLKYGLVLSDEPVTLELEMENVRDYLNVSNVCMTGKIHLQIQVDEMCSQALMPRMTLQPLVENCIKHGFARASDGEAIRILGWMKEDCFLIRVTDNGRGVTPEVLNDLRRQLEGSSQKGDIYSGSSIGLFNVHRRIQLSFGMEYGLSINSIEGRGFSVEIRLPLGEGKEEEEL